MLDKLLSTPGISDIILFQLTSTDSAANNSHDNSFDNGFNTAFSNTLNIEDNNMLNRTPLGHLGKDSTYPIIHRFKSLISVLLQAEVF